MHGKPQQTNKNAPLSPGQQCAEPAAPTIVVAVKSLIVYNQRALIMRRSFTDRHGPGIWEFTGGRLEFGETLEDGLLREIQEETGLEAAIQKLLYAVTLPTGPTRQIVVLNYLTYAAGDKVRLSSEHQDYRWATKQDMLELLDPQIVKNLHKYNVFSKIDILEHAE